ncbi:MAG: hypothetical protein NTU61_01585 [Candidatus Altiarchaeota archaeon]|nr:hypothetical protein [Candidatus Altiarchaeota archaeon]
MSKITQEVEREITEDFIEIYERLGVNPVLVRTYMKLFFSTEPLGLKELSEKTGYSISSVCATLDLMEKMMDVKKFKKPGSKKVYYECEHKTTSIMGKKIVQADNQIQMLITILKKAESKLDSDKSPESKLICENLKKVRKDYDIYHHLIHDMIGLLNEHGITTQ